MNNKIPCTCKVCKEIIKSTGMQLVFKDNEYVKQA